MIKDITLGQFFPGSSFLHRLDPRMKIILVILYIVALFLPSTVVGYLLTIFVTVFLMLLSKIPIKMYLRGLRPLFFIACFTVILNLFYTGGDVIFSFWIITITKQGIVNAVFMLTRIMMLVIATSMLTYTTSPIVLTNGLERLLSPLKVIKVPVHDFSMIMTIALRFIPTLLEETEKIMSAQKARGADFESGSIINRARALIPILIPLFRSAMNHAVELATAMECRCYSGDNKKRTHLVKFKLRFADFEALIFLIVLMVILIFLNNIRIFGV